MAETTIEWTATTRADGTTVPGFTFNPWRGCSRLSEGCRNCYADAMSKRNPLTLGVWGPNGTRVVASESMWREPLKWGKAAKAAGERHRVFCASLGDVFEGWQGAMVDSRGERLYHPNDSWNDRRPWVPVSDCGGDEKPITMADVRRRLFDMIDATPNLDWLVLTKRPENIARMMPTYFTGVSEPCGRHFIRVAGCPDCRKAAPPAHRPIGGGGGDGDGRPRRAGPAKGPPERGAARQPGDPRRGRRVPGRPDARSDDREDLPGPEAIGREPRGTDAGEI